MAYSSVRVQFEIGHEASIRTKKTPEGFTHDWEVFVRGADNTDIQCFVEKIVFHLHETFPKPRRVIKEPPYLVKESGYAGFVLPIDVYLKNKEEPKKISFQYDLQLQPSGPPISRVLREPRLFQNPSEDFRRKLIRGGGVGVDTPSEPHGVDDLKVGSGPGRARTGAGAGDSPLKKHRADLVVNDSFAELFGTPIRRVPEPKRESNKNVSDPDFLKKKNKSSKYEAVKDKDERDAARERDRNKGREKFKEKTGKRLSSPVAAPTATRSREEQKKHDEKRREDHEEKKKKKDEREKKEKERVKEGKDVGGEKPPQPEKEQQKRERKETKELEHAKKSTAFRAPTLTLEKHNTERDREKPEKEKHRHRHKKKEKEKNKEREKQKKERDKEREKDKDRQGEKDRDRGRERERNGKKKNEDPRDKEEGKQRRKSTSPSEPRGQERAKKKPLNALLDELGSSDSASPLSDDEGLAGNPKGRTPISRAISDHKPRFPPPPLPPLPPPLHPSAAAETGGLAEVKGFAKDVDKHSSCPPNAVEAPSNVVKKDKSSKKKSKRKKSKEQRRPRSPTEYESEGEAEGRAHPDVVIVTDRGENDGRGRGEEEEEEEEEEEAAVVVAEEDGGNGRGDDDDDVDDDDDDDDDDENEDGNGDDDNDDSDGIEGGKREGKTERGRMNCKEGKEVGEKEKSEDDKRKSARERERENKKKKGDRSEEKLGKFRKGGGGGSLDHSGSSPRQGAGVPDFPDGGDDPRRSDRFTKEYVAQLKDLQHRIMSLEDNAELQKVVKVIAETGQYEITKKTFDFDLCALDFDTVKRLQNFFVST